MLALVVPLVAVPQLAASHEETERPVVALRAEAERVQALVQSRGARRFLEATRALPAIEDRVVYQQSKTRKTIAPSEYERLAPEERAEWTATTLGEEFYYLTKYGSPIAYARILDVIARAAGNDGDALLGKRVLDFGYGGIGHLRLLASLGNDVVGVDVDPMLAAYYRAEDQGVIQAATEGGKTGRLQLVNGFWPGDEAVKQAVGGGFDVIVSKNVLKRGYVTPIKPVDKRMLVQLGVSPEEFLRAIADALVPGGVFAIYNLCPAQKDSYLPMADGLSPFTREQYEGAGFEVLAIDVDDREQIKELGWALKWDEQGMDVEGDLFAWYTLARKKGAPRPTAK